MCRILVSFANLKPFWQWLLFHILKEWKSRPFHWSLARHHSTNRFLLKWKSPELQQITNSSIKPNKYHSTYVCFGGQKTHEQRKIWLKVCLFGFPDGLVSRSAPTVVMQRSSGWFHPQHRLVHLNPVTNWQHDRHERSWTSHLTFA